MTIPLRAVAVFVALLLALAACSSNDRSTTGAQQPPPPNDSASGDSTNPTTPGAGATASTDFVSAAEASRAAAEANAGKQFGGEEFGLSQQELGERSEAVEAAIGGCMAAAGFEYSPVDFGTISRAMSSDKSAPGLSTSEFVAEYGFGISTQFDKPIVELSLGDVNLQIVDNLGEADRVAYLRTLFGEHTDATYAFALETENFSRTGGCTRQAVEQSFTEAEMSASYFNPGDALIETDPRAIQAIADWHRCMVDGGLEGYLHPDDVEFSFQRRIDVITGGQDPEELTGEAAATLADLQAEERAVAAVFTDCEVNVLDPIMHQVESDYYGQ